MTTGKAAGDFAGLRSRVGRRLTGLGLATGGCLVNASATTCDHERVSTCV
jgi:hypothetical protein